MIKINISYSTEEELTRINEWLKPLRNEFYTKMTITGKYKHLYLTQKATSRVVSA